MFIIDKKDLSSINLIDENLPDLKDVQVRFRLIKAGLTANNITYAVLGDEFKYWNFFPHDEGGILPVWGYAEVVESNCPEIENGSIYYGYFPLASYLTVNPVRINQFGFVDGTVHRKVLPQVYNYYERVNAKLEKESYENLYMIFQPLFATSFLLAHYFIENESFGSSRVLLTSASSKTALAFAFMLSQMDTSIKIVGLTSPSNVDFCNETGLYHEMVTYNEIGTLEGEQDVVVDFAGNHAIRVNLQDVLGDKLIKCVAVGLSHWDEFENENPFKSNAELFFAPDHAVKKQKEWGGKTFKVRLDQALMDFIRIADP